MLPIETRTAQGRHGVMMPGDYVEITACRCNPAHGRFGIIFESLMPSKWSMDPRADFLVLLASGSEIAEYCRPLELRPATEDDVANALPKHLRQRKELIVAKR